jgi:hypothetical protein
MGARKGIQRDKLGGVWGILMPQLQYLSAMDLEFQILRPQAPGGLSLAPCVRVVYGW